MSVARNVIVRTSARRLLGPLAPISGSNRPRKITSAWSLSAYAALVVFLPVHVLSHRLAPSGTSSPIQATGPAELDYEFVKTGLHLFPLQSWVPYVGLVGSVLVHAVEGANVLRMTWLGSGVRLSSRAQRIVVGVVALPVILGLRTLSREPLTALSLTVERYGTSFTASWVYRVA